MRLLSLTLSGQYKGLKDQTFNFESAQGNIVAFIGLNGAGKSQLLELIGEAFSFLERYKRRDFKVRDQLGFSFTLVYKISIENDPNILDYPDEFTTHANNKPTLRVSISNEREVEAELKQDNRWVSVLLQNNQIPTPYIVGYSSGLNENLQRSFMKNAVQFFDVMRVRHNRRKELSGNVDESDVSNINRHYLSRYPHVFSNPYDDPDHLSLAESDTKIPANIYLDYDSCALMMCAFSMLSDQEINDILRDVRFKFPRFIRVKYDLRGGLAGEDSIRDIQLLIRAAGQDNVEGIGKITSEEVFEVYELNYLTGYINFDLANTDVKRRLMEFNYEDPFQLFERMYKLQLLGVNKWQGETRKKLRDSSFMETVKKPLKGQLPLLVDRLELADDSGRKVSFDDLSDGESQLIQILAAIRIFKEKEVLFLLDEPDTHLNPSWRTYFHSFVEDVLGADNDKAQLFVSTHSPFMISSLKRNNVCQFRRDDNGLIDMNLAQHETYGASFDVLIKDLFDLRSLISQSVIDEIREQLKQGDSHARQWIEENLGLSAEKAYLLRKLSQ